MQRSYEAQNSKPTAIFLARFTEQCRKIRQLTNMKLSISRNNVRHLATLASDAERCTLYSISNINEYSAAIQSENRHAPRHAEST